jgi:hypothetical protein
MNGVLSAACDLADFLAAREWRHCFIGGIAVLRWGEARFTADADVTLFTGFYDEPQFVDTLLSAFQSRLPDARSFALENRVVLIQHANGTQLDIVLAGLPFESRAVDRASNFELLAKRKIATCSAEDLIVHKVFAGRPKDWMDVEGVIGRNRSLDWALIQTELTPLLEIRDDAESMPRLNKLKVQYRN